MDAIIAEHDHIIRGSPNYSDGMAMPPRKRESGGFASHSDSTWPTMMFFVVYQIFVDVYNPDTTNGGRVHSSRAPAGFRQPRMRKCKLSTVHSGDIDPAVAGGQRGHGDQECLARALWSLGAAIDTSRVPQGPKRPLTHGNVMLAGARLQLSLVDRDDVKAGRFIMCQFGHAVAVMVDNCRSATVIDGDRSKAYPSLSGIGRRDSQRWYELHSIDSAPSSMPSLTMEQRLAVDTLWSNARRRKALPDVPVFRDAGTTELSSEQLSVIAQNRAAALRRRAMCLIRPTPPRSWPHVQIPRKPDDMLTWDLDVPNINFLEYLHSHPRDHRVRFYADTHTYLVDGRATRGSVTGLVHMLAQPFKAEEVIARMMAGSQWPRAGPALSCSTDRQTVIGPFRDHLEPIGIISLRLDC